MLPEEEWLLREWLRKAEGDLDLASHIASDAAVGQRFREQIGFHCQQAAEKYPKALLTHAKLDVPKSHDIKRLLDTSDAILGARRAEIDDAKWLTPFGVEVRYPADSPEMLPGEEFRAIEIATRVKTVVLDAMASRGFHP